MKTYAILFPLFLLLGITEAHAQKSNFLSGYLNSLMSDSGDVRKPRLLVYPSVAYAPETSWQFGVSSLYVYYARRDTVNRLSSINSYSFYTLEKQYGLWIDHTLYSDENKWIIQGRARFQRFPMLYFGIGPNTSADFLARVEANQIQIRERVLRSLVPNLYFGLHVDFQRHSSLNFIPSTSEPIVEPLGSNGSTNLAFGLGLMYDSRYNILNARQGIFTELAFLRYDQAWGSDASYTSLISDLRAYKAINRRDVLAFQAMGQVTIGHAPFNQLALLGSESIMRGYYTGRYRDNNQLALQAEYRFLPLPLGFTDRLGATLFASTGSVFDKPRNLAVDNFKWAGGAGLRLLLFPQKDVWARFDVAFTEEGRGFYIFIGEAF